MKAWCIIICIAFDKLQGNEGKLIIQFQTKIIILGKEETNHRKSPNQIEMRSNAINAQLLRAKLFQAKLVWKLFRWRNFLVACFCKISAKECVYKYTCIFCLLCVLLLLHNTFPQKEMFQNKITIYGVGVLTSNKKEKVLCQIMGQLQPPPPPLLSIAVFAYSVWVSELYMYMYCTTWMLLIVTRYRTFVSLKYCIRWYHFVFTCACMIVFAWKGVISGMFPNSVINVCGFEIKGFLCTWNKVHFRD